MSAPDPARPATTRSGPSTAVGAAGRWRARASVAEGLTNLRDGSVLGAALVALTVLVVGGALLVDVVTAARVLRAEDEYLAAGGDLLVATGQAGASIDAAACASLADVTGVRAAFGTTTVPAAAALVGRPESQQTLVTATAGVLDVADLPALGADQVVVSQTIADRWQWAVGSRLQLDPVDAASLGAPTGVLTVAGVADLALLSEGASTGVLAVQPATGEVATCMLAIEPQYRQDLRDTVPAVLGETAASAVTVADRLPAGALAQDPAVAFATRTTRWAGAAGGVVVGLLWAVVAWTRRSRAALYASIGVPYAGGVLLRWTEGVAAVLVGGLWGAVLALTCAVTLADVPAGLAFGLVARGGTSAVCVALVLVLLTGLWQPRTLAALKDR